MSVHTTKRDETMSALNKPSFVKGKILIAQFNDIEKRLLQSGVILKESDSHAVGMLAVNLVDFNENKALLDEEGIMLKVRGDKGHTIHKKNIRADYMKDLQANIRFYINQLGMSPKSRGSKATEGAGSAGDGFEEFI